MICTFWRGNYTENRSSSHIQKLVVNNQKHIPSVCMDTFRDIVVYRTAWGTVLWHKRLFSQLLVQFNHRIFVENSTRKTRIKVPGNSGSKSNISIQAITDISSTRTMIYISGSQWRHNERDSVSNRRCLDCLLNHFFRRRSKKTPKLRMTGLCEGNLPVTDIEL